eukprot:2339842-Pleurochrysis_carterae.AAC.2
MGQHQPPAQFIKYLALLADCTDAHEGNGEPNERNRARRAQRHAPSDSKNHGARSYTGRLAGMETQ